MEDLHCCPKYQRHNGQFPLQNKERLSKWIKNMKRENWFPTKHQCICSDHFTADSFEWRWGIRYLKTHAIPTLFSFPTHQQDKKKNIRRIRRKSISRKGTSKTKLEIFGPAASTDIKSESLELPLASAHYVEQAEGNAGTNTAPTLVNENLEFVVQDLPIEPFTIIYEVEMKQLLNNTLPVDTEVLHVDHSYCRQNTDKAQLWEKISRLRKKIKKLKQQERRTTAELNRMEKLIQQLKQENLISEVKMKVMENCFTEFELNILQ
ncbi:THAP domain-containing protein 5-like isoform X2 [Hypanus sabinus]|uniref:THAP domain-containing protein 5-like isoform X2 n=1 Tax=Hypanus sabinus TaxID=79690 RepID=UPI0028C423CF|nr:THAP domain-containing protein 5-like isoform X2 [Hypanus sabinus]